MVNNTESKVVYYKETTECLRMIFWPHSQWRVNCNTAM